MTYKELQDLFLQITDSTGSTSALAIIKDFLGLGQEFVLGSHQWPFQQKSTTVTSVVGNPRFTLAVDAEQLLWFRRQDVPGMPIFKQPEIFYDLVTNLSLSGEPQMFTSDGLSAAGLIQYRFDYSPSEARVYEYGYIARATELTNDTDVPSIPASFHWLILQAGLKTWWEMEGESARAAAAAQMVELGRDRLILRSRVTTVDVSPVGGTRGGDSYPNNVRPGAGAWLAPIR